MRITALLFLLFTSFQVASKSANDEFFDLSIEELLKVEITGVSSQVELYKTSPANVSVFDQSLIKLTGADTLLDLIRYVPGFQLFRGDDKNAYALGARGKVLGASSRQVLLVIDGIRKDVWWSGGSFYDFNHLSLTNVAKVEFIRGALSHIYGSNAYLGVINIVTKSNVKDVTLMANDKAKRLDTNFSFSQHGFEHSLHLNILDSKGERYNVINKLNGNTSPITDPLSVLQLDYRVAKDNWQITLNHYDSAQNKFYVTGFNSETFNKRENKRSEITATINNQLSDDQHLTSHVFYRDFSLDGSYEILGTGSLAMVSIPSSAQPARIQPAFNEQSIGITSTLNTEINDKLSYQIAAELIYSDLIKAEALSNYNVEDLLAQLFPVDSFEDLQYKASLTNPATETKAAIQALIDYEHSFARLSVGLRYDNSDISGDTVTPRLAMVKPITDKQSVKLIYAESFRSPTAVELYTKNTGVILGNPELKPEIVKSTEFIWLYDHKGNRLNITFFENKFKNEITDQFGEGFRTFVNSGNTSNTGLELGFVLPFTQNMTLSGNYTKMFEQNADMYRLAKEFARIHVNYFYSPTLYTNLTAEYTGKRAYLNLDNEITAISGYHNVYANMTWQYSNTVSIKLTVNNLLNSNHFNPSFNASAQAIPTPSRDIQLSAKWRF